MSPVTPTDSPLPPPTDSPLPPPTDAPRSPPTVAPLLTRYIQRRFPNLEARPVAAPEIDAATLSALTLRLQRAVAPLSDAALTPAARADLSGQISALQMPMQTATLQGLRDCPSFAAKIALPLGPLDALTDQHMAAVGCAGLLDLIRVRADLCWYALAESALADIDATLRSVAELAAPRPAPAGAVPPLALLALFQPARRLHQHGLSHRPATPPRLTSNQRVARRASKLRRPPPAAFDLLDPPRPPQNPAALNLPAKQLFDLQDQLVHFASALPFVDLSPARKTLITQRAHDDLPEVARQLARALRTALGRTGRAPGGVDPTLAALPTARLWAAAELLPLYALLRDVAELGLRRALDLMLLLEGLGGFAVRSVTAELLRQLQDPRTPREEAQTLWVSFKDLLHYYGVARRDTRTLRATRSAARAARAQRDAEAAQDAMLMEVELAVRRGEHVELDRLDQAALWWEERQRRAAAAATAASRRGSGARTRAARARGARPRRR